VPDVTRGSLRNFALIGFLVWLSGAVMFRFGGHLMFESGPLVLTLSALGIAGSVCLLLRSIMTLRKAPIHQSVEIAVAMALPGLLGDVGYILAFHAITGLSQETAGAFAAVVIFGNAALLAYALVRALSHPINAGAS
jgi:hypothetical protein